MDRLQAAYQKHKASQADDDEGDVESEDASEEIPAKDGGEGEEGDGASDSEDADGEGKDKKKASAKAQKILAIARGLKSAAHGTEKKIAAKAAQTIARIGIPAPIATSPDKSDQELSHLKGLDRTRAAFAKQFKKTTK
jgi:hypothetical protein